MKRDESSNLIDEDRSVEEIFTNFIKTLIMTMTLRDPLIVIVRQQDEVL